MKTFLCAVVLFGLFVSVPAFAQNSGVTEYDFELDSLEGATLKPLEDNIDGNPHGKRTSLIKVRSDFVNEIIKSTDDI